MTKEEWLANRAKQPLDQKCGECDKAICDDEYVVNWGSCDECFDRHYEEYLSAQESEYERSEDKDGF